MSEERLYLYPVWLRIWHWSNTLLIIILTISGLCLQYANPDVQFLPFELSVSIHNISGIIATVLFLVFIVGNFITKNGKYYRIRKKLTINKLIKQFRHYTYGIFNNEPAPFPVTKKRKFNPLQLFSYIFIMHFFLPLIIISGIVLLYPEFIPKRLFGMSGIHLIDLIHIASGFVVSLFMVVHVYFCTMGHRPLSLFKSMINGWH